jgi:hypothetical protein
MKKYLPIVLMLFILILLTACGKDKHEIDNELSVEFNGYDEHGEVDISIDKGELYDRLAAMKEIDDDVDMNGMFELDSIVSDLEVEAKPNEDLKNGDKVELELSYDEDNSLDIALDLKDPKIEVEGLAAIKTLSSDDVFSGVELQYEGISPFLSAEVDASSNEAASAFSYSIPEGPFKNGEEITITAEPDSDLLAYGYKVEEDKFAKKIEVPSEKKYVEKWEDLNKEDQQYILTEVQDNVTANFDSDFDSLGFYDKGEYIASGSDASGEKSEQDEQYILFAKSDEDNSGIFSSKVMNSLRFIYKNKITFSDSVYTDEYANTTHNNYTVVEVDNLTVDEEGNLDREEMTIEVTSDTDLDKATLKSDVLDKFKDEYTVTKFDLA